MPYQFEPEVEVESDADDGEYAEDSGSDYGDEEHDRLLNTNWLDYILADWYVKRATTNCRVYPMQSQVFDSDHRIVVMTAAFPSRKEVRKIFRKPRPPSSRPDIRKLRDDPELQGKYSAKLDALLLETNGNRRELDIVEDQIVEAILQASQEMIPSRNKIELDKPWTNPTYQELTQKFLIQTCSLTEQELDTIEIIWNGFLRRMVKDGYQRVNAPTGKEKKAKNDNEVDWRFKISNAKLREITKTLPIRTFCQRQHIKYLGHVCRLGNWAIQKQILFDTRTPNKIWLRIEKLLSVDKTQARRAMMSKTELMRLMDVSLPPSGAPQGQTCA
ncbi:hypothetical protein AC249_AIPGENE10765 [Exaiptasia diaphana]|nr:hypothetical protein AC249_AIPGENE10765 [Exaiptasia diaphana]